MRILYGVQGTGNGHISRARAMAPQLRARGIEADFLFTGRERQLYFDMEVFGEWQCHAGLSFVTGGGRVRPLATLQRNNLPQLWRDIRQLDLSAYDLVVSDFEPISAWAARRQQVPSLGLGHQYAFLHPVPMEGDSWLSRRLIRHFAPARQQLGLHWHHFGQPILPPIIDLDEQPAAHSDCSVLVYLGFENAAEVIPLLHTFPHTHFVYYGQFEGASERGNVSLRPLSTQGFKQALRRCDGVICNAGFELASEALHLGKRLLVKPLQGQMEQLSNARALEQLGLGSRMQSLSASDLGQWLKRPLSPHCQYPNVAAAIADWIADGRREPVAELSRRLWQNARVGEMT